MRESLLNDRCSEIVMGALYVQSRVKTTQRMNGL